MNSWRAWLSIGGASAAVLAALYAVLPAGEGDSVTGVVVDAASGEPVQGARVLAGDRLAVLYRTGAFALRLDPRVPHTLHVTAPGYADSRVVTGREPVRIAMQGTGIPGLGGVIAWPRMEQGKLVIDVQLRDAAGGNIDSFPRISLPAFIRLHENLGTPETPVRGAPLFEGMVPDSYDPAGKVTKLRYEVPLALVARASGRPHAVLEFTLASPAGSFSTTRGDVVLAAEGRGKG